MSKKTSPANPPTPGHQKVNLATTDLSPLVEAAEALVETLEDNNAYAMESSFRPILPMVLDLVEVQNATKDAIDVMAAYAPELREAHGVPRVKCIPGTKCTSGTARNFIALENAFLRLYSLLCDALRGKGTLGEILRPRNQPTMPDARNVILIIRRIIERLKGTPPPVMEIQRDLKDRDNSIYFWGTAPCGTDPVSGPDGSRRLIFSLSAHSPVD